MVSLEIRQKPGKRQLPHPSKSQEKKPAPKTDPLNLTFGIEIECLLMRDTSPDRAEEAPIPPQSGRQAIYNVLSQNLTVRCASCNKMHEFKLPLNRVLSSRHQLNETDPSYQRWTIDEDSSVGLTDPEWDIVGEDDGDYIYFDRLEIKGRVINASTPLLTRQSRSDPSHTHSVGWQDEIDAVYAQLIKVFNTPPGVPNCRLIVNRTCGLHVHMGNGLKGFPLSTVKNVLSMYVANEAAIDSMHSVDRVTGTTMAFSTKTLPDLETSYPDHDLPPITFNQPWSTHFHHLALKHMATENYSSSVFTCEEVEREFPGKYFPRYSQLETATKQNDVPSWLMVIRFANDIYDLRQLQGALAHNSTVNLQNLVDYSPDGSDRGPSNNKKMTIEFRQQSATLRSAEIIAWISFLLSLFIFCDNQSQIDMRTRCEAIWRNPSHTALDLLSMVDAPLETPKHYERVLGLAPNQSTSCAAESMLERIPSLHASITTIFLPLYSGTTLRLGLKT